MTDDRSGVSFDARTHTYRHSEKLSQPAAPPGNAFTVQFEASGVVTETEPTQERDDQS